MIYTVSKKTIILLLVMLAGFILLDVNALSQSTIDANNKSAALKNKVDYQTNARKCWWLGSWEAIYWEPSKKYFDAAKSINTKLQDLWDNWQTKKDKYLKDAYSKLAIKSLSYFNKCLYSWTIDALENQRWDWRYYKTKSWAITVWIDFWSYKDKLTDIDFWPISWPLFQFKNTATKVREYKLASNIQLQNLYTDNKWYISYVNNRYKFIYLNNLNKRLNSFCNNQKIYTEEELLAINRNENNVYCIKNKLKANLEIISFLFNPKWEIIKVDLNRRRLSNAN